LALCQKDGAALAGLRRPAVFGLKNMLYWFGSRKRDLCIHRSAIGRHLCRRGRAGGRRPGNPAKNCARMPCRRDSPCNPAAGRLWPISFGRSAGRVGLHKFARHPFGGVGHSDKNYTYSNFIAKNPSFFGN
jgi:hypothetical protein